jgi:hypothetical protein
VLLLELWLEEANPRLLPELFATTDTGPLKGWARRWAVDPAPFAREQLRDYIADGCDRPGHRALVKALYKAVEGANDAQAMSWFMVAFDRLAPRELVEVVHWDWNSRTTYAAKELHFVRTLPRGSWGADRTGRFSKRTRLYLARRALRWYRHLGFRDPVAFRAAALLALKGYDDQHLNSPEHLLSAWGLTHLIYYGNDDILRRQVRGIAVAWGKSLDDLVPAPLHPQVWATAPEALLNLVCEAHATVVRTWAHSLLRQDHSPWLDALDLDAVRALLTAGNDQAVELGIERLEALPGLNAVGIELWLELLAIEHGDVLPRIIKLVETHVSPKRLRRDQLLALAQARFAPPALLGLGWLRDLSLGSGADLESALGLMDAPVPSVRAEALTWIAELLRISNFAQAEHVRDLLDARYEEARAVGLSLLTSERWRDETLLWAALPETPYPNVQVALVDHLRSREAQYSPKTRQQVWARALLAIHGGGRARGHAVRQIAQRLRHHPSEADALLRLLGLALRSVRVTDRRAALAAVTQAAFERPELRPAIAEHLPELTLFAQAPEATP